MQIHMRRLGIPCKTVLRHIEAELDSALDQAAYRQIKEHLKQCLNCFMYLDSLKKIVYLYKTIPPIHPTGQMRKKLLHTLQLTVKNRHVRTR